MDVPARYVDVIEARYPELDTTRLDFVQDGFNNDVVIVDETVVCRFPKQPWGGDMIMHEARVLDLVNRHVELSVPVYDVVERDLVSYAYVPGDPLTHLELLHLSELERRRCLEALGRYLHALHHVPEREIREAGVGMSAVACPPSRWLELYEQVRATLFPMVRPHQRELIAHHFTPVLTGELDLHHEPVLIDGDLAVYHLLYDRDAHELVGKIDFGTAGLGDPAFDVGLLLSNYGETLVRRLAPAYPGLEDLMDRARFYAGAFELQWALSGIENDEPWLTFAHLGGARDMSLIGSPARSL